MHKSHGYPGLLRLILLAGLISPALAQTPDEGLAAQLSHGADVFSENCASCHGLHLNDGTFAPPLRGNSFHGRWKTRKAADLLSYISANMPAGAAGTLDDGDYTAVLALILKANGQILGPAALDPQSADFKTLAVFAGE